MEQSAVARLIAVLCLMCMAGARAEDVCAPYVRPDFTLQQSQTCLLFCSGTCTNRYCSIIPGTVLDQTQFMCILNNLYMVIGLGIALFLLLVGSVVCCFCRCMFGCCCGHRSQHII